MNFNPFQVDTPHLIYALLGAFVVIFGMFSLFIREKVYIGEAPLAFIFGIAIGPYGANIFNPRQWGGGNVDTVNTIVLEFCRVVLAIGVFAIGVELPKAYMKRHWKSILFLIVPVMTWGWFVSAGFIYALIPGLNFISSLAVAACLTPTDPILAAAVVGGKYADKHVPAHLRHLLAAESGCNDGAAFPFLFIALYLTIDPTTGRAIENWFLALWLYQIVMGVVLGALIGFGFRHLMKFCEHNDLIDRQSYIAQYVSLAMLTIGVCTLLGTDDLLAAFSCGTAFAWDGFFNKQTEESVFSSVIDLLFNIAAFVFVGAWMPFDDFSNPSLTLTPWRLIVIAILVLLLRRLPVMVALYKWIPDVKTFREALFSGHFGPMGIGAVFISTLAAEQLPKPASPPQGQSQLLAASIQPIVAFMVLCSIVTHGLSIPFFSLGRRVHSVSRTWSRHDTFGTFSFTRERGSLPEWTQQTRQIRPGEVVVINRDRPADIEEGLAPSEGTDSTMREKTEESAPVLETRGEGDEERREREFEQEKGPRREAGDRREEDVPDGSETVQEWQEGPHRIIERRSAPGEEVEVEVQRNVHGEEEPTTHTFRVAEDYAQNAVKNVRERIHNVPHELFERAANEADEVEHRIVPEGLQQALGLQGTLEGTEDNTDRHDDNTQEGAAEEGEEGWMSASEHEGDTDTEGHSSSLKNMKNRLKQAKHRISRSPSGSAHGRRKPFSRRGLFAHRAHSGDDIQPHSRVDESAFGPSTEADGSENRGRLTRSATGALRHPNLRLDHRIDSIRSTHSRVESLRSPRSRDQSPARSVRFADLPFSMMNGNGGDASRRDSGTSTPRLMSPPPSALVVTSDDGDSPSSEGVESPRNVRFSLPNGRGGGT